MKFKVINDKQFQPITIEITIESANELRDLWHRFNVPVTVYKRSTLASDNLIPVDGYNDIVDVWEKINTLCKREGVRIYKKGDN
jgi:hypothetical protein